MGNGGVMLLSPSFDETTRLLFYVGFLPHYSKERIVSKC